MAAIDFPSNPTQGFEYSPPGLDTVYTFQNGVWTGVVTVADIYLPLTGGDLTGDVLFKSGADTKILLSTTGNANFAGDVDIDGNLALGTIADVEAAILAATPGGSGDQISSGTSVLNFTAADGNLQSNVTFQPTVTNSRDLGSTTLGWANAYINTKLFMGADIGTAPYIVVDGTTGKFQGVGDLEIGPIGSPAVVVDNDGTIAATGNFTIGPIGGSASITLNTSGEITGTSLAGTGTVNLLVDNSGKLVRGAAVPDAPWVQNGNNLYPAVATSDLLIGGTLPGTPNASITNLGVADFTALDVNNGDLVVKTAGTASITLQNDGDIAMSGDITGCTGVSGSAILTVAGAGIVLSNTAAGSYVFTNAGSATNKGTLNFGSTTDSRIYTFPDKDGTVAMTSDFTGTGVTFKGTTNVTGTPPTPVAAGDIYINTVAGTATNDWTGIETDTVALNQLLFYVNDTGAGSPGWQLGGVTDSSVYATLSGDNIFTGDNTFDNIITGSVSGNAGTATTLATTRTLWGQNFNGSANVEGALTGVTTIDASGDVTFGAKLITDNLTIYEGGGVEPTQGTITGAEFDLRKGIAWTAGAIDIPNPTNGVAGMTGQILLTAAPNSWGNAFKFPGGVGNVQPTTQSYPALVPYFVQNSGVILLGNVISY